MSKDEFEKEVIAFMARIDEHMTNQNARCNSHAADIKTVKVAVQSLNDTRTFIKGMLAMGTKVAVAAGGISGLILTFIKYFGPHADKVKP